MPISATTVKSLRKRGGYRVMAEKARLESEGLRRFAQGQSIEPPQPSKVKSALGGLSRVLNFGTAAVAGAVKGALNPNLSIGQGVKEGIRRNIGFSDVAREDLGINPKSRVCKIALGGAGFIADVVFDPITYLTFGLGTGLKIGGKSLTKAGTKAAQELSEAAVKGASKAAGKELAGQGTEEILQRTVGSNIMEKIVNRAGGQKVIDEGGIKFFGTTLIKGETIAASKVGQADPYMGNTEIGKAVTGLGTAAKNTLGKMFSYGFGRNEKVLNLLDQ